MKFKFFMLPVLFITGSVLFFASCEKENSLSVQADQATFEASSIVVIDDSFIKEITQEVAAYKAQLTETAESNLSPCPTKIVVPDDYPTIQEAVDAACHENGTDIIVKAGTYEGIVYVTKPDLHIKANGEVILIGGFFLNENADNTLIHKFNIVLYGNTGGIAGYSFTGGEFKQNTISGSGYVSDKAGIAFTNVFDVKIKQNTISNLQWGITFSSFNVGPNQNNTIQDNTISEIYLASAIHFQGDSDDNMIKGNTITNCTSPGNGGITFIGIGGNSDNNTIKNNVVTEYPQRGIWFAYGYPSGNTIGPNNVTNSNKYGIVLDCGVNDTHVFNNTALNNIECDITNCTFFPQYTNTFSNNEADCTFGL